MDLFYENFEREWEKQWNRWKGLSERHKHMHSYMRNKLADALKTGRIPNIKESHCGPRISHYKYPSKGY